MQIYDDFKKMSQQFLSDWVDHNEPISIMLTGGGISLMDITKLPGASGFISKVFIPYSTKDSADFASIGLSHDEKNGLSDGSVKFVSQKATEMYMKSLCDGAASQICVVVNASLTTNRWRKGNNEAFISIRGRDGIINTYHYEMNKSSEHDYDKMSLVDIINQRHIEDIRITDVVMCLLNGGEYNFIDIDECVRNLNES